MKKRIFIVLVMAIMLLSLVSFNKVDAELIIGSVYYSKNNNLFNLDYSDIDGEDNYYIHSTKSMYVNETNPKINILLRSDMYPGEDNEIELIGYSEEREELFCDYVYFGESPINLTIGKETKEYYLATYEATVKVYSLNLSCMNVVEELDSTSIMVSVGNTPSTFSVFEEDIRYLAITGEYHPTIYASYSAMLSDDDIKALLAAEDDYKGIISSDIVVDTETYQESYNKLGTYQVDVSVSDGYNEESTYINICVVDKISPSITGNEVVSLPVNEEITDAKILANFEAIDGYDGNINESLKIIGTYNNNPGKLLSQSLTIEATDNSGNKIRKAICIKTVDVTAPTITGQDTIYLGYETVVFKDKIIRDYFTITDDFDASPSIKYVTDEYTSNIGKVGTYKIKIEVSDKSGNTSSKEFSIVVSDSIKPIIYLNAYLINTSSNVRLSEQDFADLLYSTGELKKYKRYNATVLNNTYTGNESKEGIYCYSVSYRSDDGETVDKVFQINVLDNSYVVEERVNTIKTETKDEVTVLLTACVTSLSSLLFVLFKGKKKVKIK